MTTYIIGGILLLAFCYAAYRTLFAKGDCCGCDGCSHCHHSEDHDDEENCCCHKH